MTAMSRRMVALIAGALIAPACLLFGVCPALANECGQVITVAPKRSLGPGPPPLAIGDSVLYDAAETLSQYGFETNAMVCRTMAQGIVWLEAHRGGLPELVVVALGTNGAVTDGQIDQLLTILGPERTLALVTPRNGNYAYVPALIRAAAHRLPRRIELLDWDSLSATHPNWFAPDGIHLGGAAGIAAYARLVASALLGPTGNTPVAPTTPGPSTTIQPATKPHRPHPPVRPAQSRTPPTTRRPRSATLNLSAAWSAFGAIQALCLAFLDE